MAVMIIRDLDDEVRDRLRVRATRNKRSMEAEVRAILTAAVGLPVERSFAEALIAFGAAVAESGVDLESLPRNEVPRGPLV